MSPLLPRLGYRALRWNGLSLLLRPRSLAGLAALTLLLLGLLAAAAMLGRVSLTPPEFLRLLWGADTLPREQAYVLWDVRLPRVLMAALSGGMLGMAGASMQSLTRNGLADPGLIGVKEAASIAVLALVLLYPALGLVWRPFAGMAGGLTVAALVVLLSRDLSRARFVLIGIGISWLLSAGISVFLTTANIRDVQTALLWMAGSLHAASWSTVPVAAGWGIAGAALLYATARAADAAALGDGIATGLGLRHRRQALLRLIGPVLLTAAAVSCVGSLGFVGLIAPHVARFVFRGNQSVLLTASALVGALLVLGADTLGRLVFAPVQLPAGVVLSAVGAPFFLALLWQRRDRL